MKIPALYRIEAPHFCAGFLYLYPHITDYAPILSYMRNWTLRDVQHYCTRKGWKCKKV